MLTATFLGTGAATPTVDRNVAGLADPMRHIMYPVDLDVLVSDVVRPFRQRPWAAPPSY